MSEENNASHLCTTEDAFEKFQAGSMYEEDEYITLSDIVPTQAQAPDLMNEICDIPYEDEVVLESNLEEQVYEVNSTNESGFDEHKMSGPYYEQFISTSEVEAGQSESIEAGHNNVPEAGHNEVIEAGHNNVTVAGPSEVVEETVKPRTSRRGRKKKIPTTDSPAFSELNNGTKDATMLAQEQSAEDLKTPGQRRRGRRPKNVSKNLDLNVTTDASPAVEVSEANQMSLDAGTPLKEDFQNDNLVQNTSVKRRGRPKKNHSNQQMSDLASSSDADLQDVSKNGENVTNPSENVLPTKMLRKRVKHMRLLSSEKSDSDFNETKETVDQNSSDTAQNQPSKRSSGKRGRPRKKFSEDFNVVPPKPTNTDLDTDKEPKLSNDDDDGDDICLSKLKTSVDPQESSILNENLCEVSQKQEADKENESNEITIELEMSEENAQPDNLSTTNDKTEDIKSETNSTMPEMTDFEYNIDNIASIKNETTISENKPVENDADPNSLLVEDTSKRPTRRRARKPLHYDEGSDEDPFANVELSDDEPIGCKRKYYSDDEYIPGKNKKGKQSDSSDSDSDIDIEPIEEELTENKRKRTFKKLEGSPNKNAKRGRKSVNEKATEGCPTDVTIPKHESGMDDDIEVCLKPSIIKTNDDKKNKELESFLAKKIQGTDIKIKKKSTVQPFEIPVIDPTERKKTVENSTQTKKVSTTSAGVQTAAVYDIPMKENVALTTEQSEKACEFLNSIVKTTAELGELMTQKSEDFIKKKINTDHVTDTFKMDYCVRKSFLLFKLAKHNLMQMEEDLAQQYDTFLTTHNLQQHREQPKVVTAAPKGEGSDSDCEIIETPVIQKSQKKKEPAAFNPKTVFLNKELSIKIAKKTPAKETKPETKKINIKGRHTVWINDSVMVKKVKPTQSFLAQDSRNKKPPDYVTLEMVNSFFKQYYRQKALAACAPYVSTEWLAQKRSVSCYFFAKAEDVSVSTGIPSGSGQCVAANSHASESSDNLMEENRLMSPKTLFSLCTQVLQNYLQNTLPKTNNLRSTARKLEHNPHSLYGLCVNTINNSNLEDIAHEVASCASTSTLLYQESGPDDDCISASSTLFDQEVYEKANCASPLTLFDKEEVDEEADSASPLTLLDEEGVYDNPDCGVSVSTLKTLCHKQIVKHMFAKDQTIEKKLSEPKLHCDKFTLNLGNVDEFQKYVEDELFKAQNTNGVKSLLSICFDLINSNMTSEVLTEKQDKPVEDQLFKIYNTNGVKSLLSICLDLINSHMTAEVLTEKQDKPKVIAIKEKQIPKPLKYLTFKSIVDIMFKNNNKTIVNSLNLPKKVKMLSNLCIETVKKSFSNSNESPLHEGLTINSINTLTEETFHNIQDAELAENLDYYEDDDSTFYEDETESGFNNLEDDNATIDNNWLSQVQMQELRSCYTPNVPLETETNIQEPTNNLVDAQPLIARVKIEPVDEFQENVISPVIVKTEPLSHNLDEMTVIPENIVTKTEYTEAPTTTRVPIQRQKSSSYNVDMFEAFVSTNKMMHSLDENPHDDEGIFSQSGLRIRRQFEPDDLSENDMGMSLLVPQTFEPLRIENNAKDCLMESSSDESTSSKKVPGKKKIEKRPRGKPKKNDSKAGNSKGPVVVTPKEKPQATNEIAMLTRRMREKIRQEEKKVVSSESDNESESIVAKKGKQKEEKNKAKSSKASEEVDESQTTEDVQNTKNAADGEIQCSNVDSTEQINEGRNASPSITNFTGFTALDQNEISSYQKYVKYVYDQILPKVSDQAESKSNENEEPVINPEDPVELLECEPTMPFFSEEPLSVKRKPGPKTKTQNINHLKKIMPKDEKENKSTEENINDLKKTLPKDAKENKSTEENINDLKKTLPKDEKENKSTEEIKKDETFIERHGWKCYPLDGNDTKLYQNTQILLEKLPESFVQTYFMYQDIASKNDEDEEVNRLTNLQSLNRSAVKEGKSNKSKLKTKIPDLKSSEQPGSDCNYDRSGSISPTFSENADELTPSEDEGGKIEDEIPPPVAKQTDNNLAKNSLMDDNDSDADESSLLKIKEELDEDGKPDKSKHKKSKSKAKVVEQVPPGPVMLTADKMMNKELNLLHAPINLDDTVDEPTPSKGRSAKHKQKSASKTSPKEHGKAEDDSSSEEEKHQWFTIKEKLLKRMVKKNDTTREDDAKRAKLVSEFIERRGDSSEAYIKRRGGRGRRVSKKKMLERQKQLKVLSCELFGDPSNDASLHPKRSQQAYFKGRRNIRKVIDKKSLARSTVVANMEEFERKRRINIRQSRLREIMQCEDGVNVLVINDEVCLEYDFEAHRPVVTIHPFFTKVMKAHQYEGVKFMWDACFESLESIAAGHPGGGCILAHCMGLGKTLQVLALLHTVLTHPRVGMQRVLVCCPLSTVLNWVDEIHKWIGPVTNQIKVFELSKLKKTSNRAYQLEDWYNGGGIFIIGYELFRSLTTLDPFLDDVRPAVVKKIRTALLDPGPDIIICDEGHLLKNDCSVLAVAMSRVVTKRRIVLTGTPMQNNLREYYCMVNFVKPNLLGTYSEYSNRFENPIMNGQHRDSQEDDIKLMKARTHILHKVLEGCLQRQEASVLYPYLPKKHEYTVFISLTQCQWDLYKHYLQNYSHTQNNKSVLKDFHILQKIWSHPLVLHNFQNRTESTRNKVKEEKLEDDLAREDLNATEDIKPPDTEVWWLQYLEDGAMLDSLASSNKFVTVFRILEESIALQDKVLIFSTSLFTMDALEYFLKKINNWSLGQEYYRLDGSVPAEVRQKWCREFNAENNHKTKLFLISTRAGCLGLNMTAANRVIILDTSWNPAHDIQSIFRVYRFGQKKDCYIYRLVALGTMEQKIYERSVTKQAVACRVVDEQQIDRHYNMADLTELYKYDETGSGVAGGVAVGVEDVVLLRVARDAALHAVHEHDSLLRGSLEQGLPEHERDAAWVQFQEEHAHKQQMQEMPPPVKVKKVKVKVNNQAPVDPASIPNWGMVKTEIEESILPNDPDFTPESARPKAKGKKGRPSKSNVVSCCIPIQPEAPEAEDPPLDDDDMVRKITHILIKHNYQNNQGPREIAELVSRVRSLVYSGNMDQLDSSDELTMSIARVLLGRDPQMTMPPLTDIEHDQQNTGEPSTSAVKQEPVETPRPPARSRGRPRKDPERLSSQELKKGYVYEAAPSTSTEPQTTPDSEGRTRRRAALAAEKNFESLPVRDPVIDIEDDDSRDNEFLPEIPIEYDGAPGADEDTDSADEIVFSNIEIKTENNVDLQSSKKIPKNNAKKSDIADVKQRKKNTKDLQTKNLDEQSSILLSDDDDYVPPAHFARKPGPARKTMKTIKVESPAASSKDLEVVPLHPSLLSNKNFIKIVAHTYLSGNPMLDEDAATLAAQYSTFKALKEFEANGKNIDSGPIYDIAIKVLGVDVLRKLHNSNVKISTSDMLAQHPINAQEAAPAKDSSANCALKQALHVHEKKESTPGKRLSLQKTPAPAQNSRPVTSAQKTEPITVTAAPNSKLIRLAPKQSSSAPPPATAVEPSVPDKKPVTIKLRLNAGNVFSAVQLTNVPASPANVVPVGLFKGAAEVPASETPSADECILPDDDDIRIVTDRAPAPPPAAPAHQRPPPPPLTPRPAATAPGRRNAQPVLLNNVTTNAQPAYPLTTVYSVPPAGTMSTISLDSDDDEPRAPSHASLPPAAPVPVSLTAVHPSAVPQHVRHTLKPKVLRKVVPVSSAVHSSGAPIILNSTMVDMQAGGGGEALPVVGQLPAGGNYILVPSSSFGPVPASSFGPVPVALNKVQYTSHAAMQQHFTSVQSPDLSNVIQIDPRESNPPVVSTDIGAEQTVESTLPDAHPDSAAKKSNKRVCKPGDILRITKGGEIEVLNRKDISKPGGGLRGNEPPPPPSVPVQTRLLRGSTEPTPTVPSELKTTNSSQKASSRSLIRTDLKPTPAPPTMDQKPTSASAINSRKGSSSSVSTIESRSPSPSDIFKNVVHIEADNYSSRVSSDSAKQSTPTKEVLSQPSTGNRNVITISSGLVTNVPGGSNSKAQGKWQNTVSHTAKTGSTAKASTANTKPSASNTKPSVSNTKPSVSNTKPSVSNTKPSASNTKPSVSNTKPSVSNTKPSASNTKPSVSNTKPSVSNTKPSASKVQPSSSSTKSSTSKASGSNTKTSTATSQKSSSAPNKAKERILDSVDLTDLDYLPAVSVSSHKKTKPQPNTIVGTSKSIILCASGKAVSKAITSTKTSTPAKPAPKVDKVTPAPKTEVKKRPAPVDNSSAKKKKTDKPMTLKDFDIDDIDDIIELD